MNLSIFQDNCKRRGNQLNRILAFLPLIRSSNRYITHRANRRHINSALQTVTLYSRQDREMSSKIITAAIFAWRGATAQQISLNTIPALFFFTAPQESQETEALKIRNELVNVSRQLQASRQPAKRDSGISPTYSTFQSIWHTPGKSLADKFFFADCDTLFSPGKGMSSE
ncbi:hypothetical protein CEXT_62041 [Caerostris extrusa]|uniref:Uncharacterized protein n=1 Tax=Caerostris extrusa TaxID=172846 RepID=A0AAV4RDA3_CAEEX|nr:hypothetical protein CEXT_62041 [Caerostris extrusa]